MSSTCRNTIPGWSMGIQSRRGRTGLKCPASGGVDRGFTSASGSHSGRSSVSGGAGRLGDSIGPTTTCGITAIHISHAARHFLIAERITAGAAISIGREICVRCWEIEMPIADTVRREMDRESDRARSAALNTAAVQSEDSPRAARAVSAASMAAGSAVEASTVEAGAVRSEGLEYRT